ncbi:MAG: ABC transporter ATP-binding protein [Desulfobacterales bacterium]
MIVLNSVIKKFNTVTAVDNITCRIAKGEYFALLGPNGAGKTTVVRMLLGFIAPTSGSIFIDSIPVSNPETRRRVGYLAEHHMIPSHLSGLEYLRRHASLIGFGGKDAVMEADRLLEVVSMKGREKEKSVAYSKGMKQRIGLAAALLGHPKLLILDEPVAGLDPIGIRDVRNILESLRDDHVTVFLNSHLLSEVEKTCRTVAIMNHGKILVKDSVQSIIGDGETLEDVFIKYISIGKGKRA